jgi:hypothetical protein
MVRPGPDSTDVGASFVDYGRSLLSGLSMVWCWAVFGNDQDWRGHQAAIASAAIEGHGMGDSKSEYIKHTLLAQKLPRLHRGMNEQRGHMNKAWPVTTFLRP